ncbi:monovalent cation/H(+) antiporter subunit G [Synechococcus sp. MIT S1220]|uniref:monovalent cation/H(+) antiporter subunit G n=1 Tax=Synechococcus sp. MIT S1220 TaxID=3082549 RepID=UPI0039B05BD0
MIILSNFLIILGLLFWLWGTLPIVNKQHSLLYKLHTLTVSDSVGSLILLFGLLCRVPDYWPLLVVTAISLSIWNTIFSYIIANIAEKKL